MSFKPIKKAIFPVAGLGTRFLPVTKSIPKEMLPIVDKPLIQYAVEEARDAGIEEIVFVTGRGKAALEDHFDRSYELEYTLKSRGKKDVLGDLENLFSKDGFRVTYTRQGEPLGLGHAVGCAASIIGDEPFAVLLADDVFLGKKGCLRQMVEVYEKTGGNLISAMEVPLEHTSRYGIITPGRTTGKITEVAGLIEKPDPEMAPSRLAVSGRYILQPEIFKYLAKGSKGAGGEIQLTDAMLELIKPHQFHAIKIDGHRFDCGSRIGWLEANIAFSLGREELKNDMKRLLHKYI